MYIVFAVTICINNPQNHKYYITKMHWNTGSLCVCICVCVYTSWSNKKLKYPLWGCVVVFWHPRITILKPGQSVRGSNVKQLAVNCLLASQTSKRDANNISVVKIYGDTTH